MSLNRANKFLLLILIVIADQLLKIWTKSNMYIGESIPILGNWFSYFFVENYGMGFGIKPKGESIKLLLTLSRLFVILIMLSGLIYFTKRNKQKLSLYISLVLAGSISNSFDNIFYGAIFSESTTSSVAKLFSDEPYSTYFQGSIVDMFHLNIGIFDGFRIGTVFNIADISITIGIICLLILSIRQTVLCINKGL